MEIIILLALLAAFVLWVMSFRQGPDGFMDRIAFGCLLLAVALLAFGDKIVR